MILSFSISLDCSQKLNLTNLSQHLFYRLLCNFLSMEFSRLIFSSYHSARAEFFLLREIVLPSSHVFWKNAVKLFINHDFYSLGFSLIKMMYSSAEQVECKIPTIEGYVWYIANISSSLITVASVLYIFDGKANLTI